MTNKSNKWLENIRSSAFDLLIHSAEQERKINIEDLGDHCIIEVSVRVIKKEYMEYLHNHTFR
jgi:hypothetical protein